MSRGNVFKLSGNMALGGPSNETYSTTELQNIKSSLRLLKARQAQKKSEHLIDIGNNYGGSYSSNVGLRSEIKKPSQQIPKDYNYYQSNANNHVPKNNYNEDMMNYDNRPLNAKIGSQSKNSNYEYERNPPIRDRNNNYSSMQKNHYANQPPSNKDIGLRKPTKNNTYQPVNYGNSARMENPYNNKINNEQQYGRQKSQTRPPLRKQPQNNQNYNPVQTNTLQDKPIKQLNRQNKTQIVQYDPSQFVQCGVGCGRKFNPDSVSKHQAICRDVFQKKRKQFNMQEQRMINEEHEQLVQRAQYQQKGKKAPAKAGKKAQEKNEKMTKWKAQSLAFRAMLKSNKNEQLSKQQQQKLNQIKSVGMIKCQYCGRSFNQQAGKKHVIFCQKQQMKNKLKK